MEDELYLENIDEFVTDQNRVVTYKWLSFTLGVHVNQAKQMLYDYVERKRKENAAAQLHVTYLLAGNLCQNGHTYHKVAVVREDKLEAMKSKFSTLASVHVYSIQKAQLRDSSPLFNTDYDILKANLQNCGKFSAICCPAATTRPVCEASRAESPPQLPPQPPPATSVPLAPTLNGNAPGTSSKQPTRLMKGIMGMFAAKANSKTKNTHKEAKLETQETPSASMTNNGKAGAKGNALNNFFGKAAGSKEGKASAEPESQKEERSAATSPVSSMDPKSPLNPPGQQEKPSREAELVRGQQRDKKRAKRRTEMSEEEKETGQLRKKRRRIKQPQSDSSSEEEDSSSLAASEDNLPEPAQKPQPQPPPAPVEASVGGKRRKRKRVLKSRTFVDDEGCIVTEKAYESESCTESEEDVRPKPSAAHKAPAGPPKKDPKEEKRGAKKGGGAPGKANKQASIMGFFQKK